MLDPYGHPSLPLAWYFEPEVLDIERRTLLADAPDYVGTLGIVPEHGAYATLPGRDDTEVLVRDGSDVRLLSNICAHREMTILRGRGRANRLVCPMHKWTYDLGGSVIGAPHHPRKPCARLRERPLQTWNGLLFSGPRDVASDLLTIGQRPHLDVSDYLLVDQHEEVHPVNWKILFEVFFDVYHVAALHPGFYRYQYPNIHSDAGTSI
ncbi:hypothetical protein EON77_12105, partial [bacterium]